MEVSNEDRMDFPNMEVALMTMRNRTVPMVDSIVAVNAQGEVIGGAFGENIAGVIAIGPVFVDPNSSSKGVGQAIMAALLDKVKRQSHTSIRLVQNTMNTKSFALYTKVAFRPQECLCYFQGPVTNPSAGGALIAPDPDVAVRLMVPEDAAQCDQLTLSTVGFERSREIREAAENKGRPSWVATKGGRIVGYATGWTVMGHAVAESEEILVRLYADSARLMAEKYPKLPPPRVHIIGRLYPRVVQWAVASGLRLLRHNWLMVIGDYRDPQINVYCPSIMC